MPFQLYNLKSDNDVKSLSCSTSFFFRSKYGDSMNVFDSQKTLTESSCCSTMMMPHILSTAIACLCVIDAKHFLNDPHSEKNAILSGVLIP